MSRSIFIAAALALAVTLPPVQAQAQAPRTFVSAAGSDSNPCSFALPCRHFQAAVDATSDGGEVDALDPAGYSPITISRGVTIEGQGWSYIAPPTGGAAITVNAGSGNVYIHGVSLNGAGVTGGTNGIVFNSGGTLTVRDSTIRNFGNDGINFAPNVTHQTQLFLSNTLVSDNISNGVNIFPAVSGGGGNVVVNHVEMENNGDGLVVNTSSGGIFVTVSDSVFSQSSATGLSANSDGSTLNVYVRNCTIASNSTGLAATGSNAVISVTRSTIVNNSAGWFTGVGGVVKSYADNNIDGNFNSGNTEPPSPLPYK